MSMQTLWFIALILFGVLEAVTVGLSSIWFAAGSLAALIACMLNAPVLVQVILFLAVSLLTLVLVRPLAQKYINNRYVPTNADRVIGATAVVTEAIDNLSNQGQVSVAGATWTARSQSGIPIPVGTQVQVLRIEGVKVLVTPISTAAPAQPQQYPQ